MHCRWRLHPSWGPVAYDSTIHSMCRTFFASFSSIECDPMITDRGILQRYFFKTSLFFLYLCYLIEACLKPQASAHQVLKHFKTYLMLPNEPKVDPSILKHILQHEMQSLNIPEVTVFCTKSCSQTYP